jgi:hypothetical protein
MTSKRKTIKAGKHERIRTLLNNIRATQPEPMIDLLNTSPDALANTFHNSCAYTSDNHAVCCEGD